MKKEKYQNLDIVVIQIFLTVINKKVIKTLIYKKKFLFCNYDLLKYCKEGIKCNNIIKHYKKILTMMMLQKKI